MSRKREIGVRIGTRGLAAISGALGLSAIFAAPALADPRLDEVVYSPYVENHMLEFETRVGQEVGDGDLKGAQTLVNELEYGVNDRLSLALVTKVERASGEPQRLTGVGIEGIYYLGQIPKLGIDAGLYLEATKGAGGGPDGGEAKLLLAKTDGRFQACSTSSSSAHSMARPGRCSPPTAMRPRQPGARSEPCAWGPKPSATSATTTGSSIARRAPMSDRS